MIVNNLVLSWATVRPSTKNIEKYEVVGKWRILLRTQQKRDNAERKKTLTVKAQIRLHNLAMLIRPTVSGMEAPTYKLPDPYSELLN